MYRPFPDDTPSRSPTTRKGVVRWRRGTTYGVDFGAPDGATEVCWYGAATPLAVGDVVRSEWRNESGIWAIRPVS